jgi:hypothetical protein
MINGIIYKYYLRYNYVGKLAEIHGKKCYSIQILLGYSACANDVSPTKS